MTFEEWCKELKRQLLFYGVGGGQVLSREELQSIYNQGCSITQAYNISSDVAGGVHFSHAYYANTEGSRRNANIHR